MPKESESQKRTIERVMHEYKHGELDSGPGGKAEEASSRREAVAIALAGVPGCARRSWAAPRSTVDAGFPAG